MFRRLLREVICIVMVVICSLPAIAANRTQEIQALRKTEQEFSAMSEKRGMFQAFVAYFTPDGFHFNPMPVTARHDFVREAQTPPEFTLAWRPVLNDVADSGDLGYSSGPWTITDRSGKNRPPLHGIFLSIWRKQANGSWRVIVDAGVRVKAPTAEHSSASWAASKVPVITANGGEKSKTIWELMARDRQFSDAASSDGLTASYGRFAFPEARLLRNDAGAVTAPETKNGLLEKEAASGRHAWLPLNGEISASGDFGYTYGTYVVTPEEPAKPATKGYYLRVWRRDSGRLWKVVADIFRPQPEARE